MSKEEIPSITLRLFGEGDTAESAEKDLQRTTDSLKGYGLKLSAKPEKQFEVLFYKGEKIGRSNLQGQGNTYKEAVTACLEDFKINQNTHNRKVRVFAQYLLEKKTPPPACEMTEMSPTLSYLI